MWELIVCVAVTWGGCVERPPVYFAGKEFCYRALAATPRGGVMAIYCRPARPAP